MNEFDQIIYRTAMRNRAKKLLHELGRLLNEGCFVDGEEVNMVPFRVDKDHG